MKERRVKAPQAVEVAQSHSRLFEARFPVSLSALARQRIVDAYLRIRYRHPRQIGEPEGFADGEVYWAHAVFGEERQPETDREAGRLKRIVVKYGIKMIGFSPAEIAKSEKAQEK